MAFQIPDGPVPFQADWFGAAWGAWWAWQQSQWQALLAWEHGARSMQQEMLDAWIAHWGGGAPID